MIIINWTKILGWLAGLALVGSAVLAGYLGVTALLPSQQPNLFETTARTMPEARVTNTTVIRLEKAFLCGNMVSSTMTVPRELIGLQLSELTQRYLPEDGWELKADLPQLLKLHKKEWDVCDSHRNYRHLGSVEGVLAIYEGPLGVEGALLQKETVQLTSLPPDLQHQIEQAQKFNTLAPETKLELRQALEFQNDSSLNEFLDNLDEFRSEE